MCVKNDRLGALNITSRQDRRLPFRNEPRRARNAVNCISKAVSAPAFAPKAPATASKSPVSTAFATASASSSERGLLLPAAGQPNHELRQDILQTRSIKRIGAPFLVHRPSDRTSWALPPGGGPADGLHAVSGQPTGNRQWHQSFWHRPISETEPLRAQAGTPRTRWPCPMSAGHKAKPGLRSRTWSASPRVIRPEFTARRSATRMFTSGSVTGGNGRSGQNADCDLVLGGQHAASEQPVDGADTICPGPARNRRHARRPCWTHRRPPPRRAGHRPPLWAKPRG